jgi:DNA-binding transcriptional LysR family regulator
MRFFMQLCKDGNFTKAAQNLYISQQGLSKSIANLEMELGVGLFTRERNSVALTEAGKYFEEHVERILREVAQLENGISAFSQERKTTVTLAFAYATLGELPSSFLGDFEEKYPKVELHIKELPDLPCETAVLNEEADIGFSIGPINEELFDCHHLERRKLCLLVNKNNSLSSKRALKGSDLAGQKMICVNEKFKTYHNFVEYCRKESVVPNIVYKGAEISVIHNLSRQNKGIGVTVDFIAEGLSYAENKNIPFANEGINWDIYLITKKGRHLERYASILKDHILRLCKSDKS